MSAASVAMYHDLLADAALAEATAEALDRRLRGAGLFFGERPLCGVLRPRFLTVAQYRELARASALVAGALETVRQAAMADEALRAQFGLTAWEEQLIHADPGFPAASPTSRLDAFWAPGEGGLQFTEYNAETPAGAAYNDALTAAFLALPAMHAFQRTHLAVPLPAAPSVVHALLDAFHAWRGVRERPVVGIIDWAEVPTASEFVLFRQAFEAEGIPAAIVDPRDAEYANGQLRFAGGPPVTLLYKRVLIDELVTREGLDSPVVRAVRDGAVCMVNPFRCKLLHKKASLAVVSDEAQAPLLTPAQREAVQRHVPWTRLVAERHTTVGGERVDLLPYVAANREQLVLKPNDEYGGKGIVLGWTVTEAEWQGAVRAALDVPTIVQRRVTIPDEPWPAWSAGGVQVTDRHLDTAPFLVDGQVVSGCLTRIASDPLLNVTAGGGSNVPTLLVEAR
jgi:uncharacterized circularly permuted ATP-grasp superfamily protein